MSTTGQRPVMIASSHHPSSFTYSVPAIMTTAFNPVFVPTSPSLNRMELTYPGVPRGFAPVQCGGEGFQLYGRLQQQQQQQMAGQAMRVPSAMNNTPPAACSNSPSLFVDSVMNDRGGGFSYSYSLLTRQSSMGDLSAVVANSGFTTPLNRESPSVDSQSGKSMQDILQTVEPLKLGRTIKISSSSSSATADVEQQLHTKQPMKRSRSMALGEPAEEFAPHTSQGKLPLKRPRSSTITEIPDDLYYSENGGYGYETEPTSRSSTPATTTTTTTTKNTIVPKTTSGGVTISPQKSRTCANISERAHDRKSHGRRLVLGKSPRQVKYGLGGERRLNIQFFYRGTLRNPIQTFGKYRLLIRNGLCGTHTMYAQPWKFEINHIDEPNELGEVRLRWSVTNLQSTATITFCETAEQAHERQTKGNTVCNLVVREALNRRACELEEELYSSTSTGLNSNKIANLKSLVKELRPKQCTEGLLFFGLRHQAAQSRDE